MSVNFKDRHLYGAGAAACAVCCAAPLVTLLGVAGTAATVATFAFAGAIFGLVVAAGALLAVSEPATTEPCPEVPHRRPAWAGRHRTLDNPAGWQPRRGQAARLTLRRTHSTTSGRERAWIHGRAGCLGLQTTAIQLETTGVRDDTTVFAVRIAGH